MTAPATPSLPAAWRRPARWLRHLPDRLLHRFRRLRARRKLLAHGKLARVLVVCHGNICRSPYAAAVLRQMLAVQVDSAGFIGPGRTPPAAALELAAARGVDLASHRSGLIVADTLRGYDLILVMDRVQQRRLGRLPDQPRPLVLLLGDFDPEPIQRRAIVDPVNGSPALFAAVYDRIDRCVGMLRAVLEGIDYQRGWPVSFSAPRR